MCGIAGILSPVETTVRMALPSMVEAQTHRGPDDSGLEYRRMGSLHLGLGFRRLAILDLSPAGHQPMVHPDTGDVLIFNGEIYNFRRLRIELEAAGERFKSQCDTEVLLRALTRWGQDTLAKLEGMYAFAFFDQRGQRLLFARDPAGIKPLFIAEVDGSLLFASEVRALQATGFIPQSINRQAVAGFLAYGALQQPQTLFTSIHALPPGTWQEFRTGSTGTWVSDRPKRHWTYPLSRSDLGLKQAISEVGLTLDHVVRDHLVADVPVGIFLSSGLDSTIIAGLAARHVSSARTFTVGFGDETASEVALATETAHLFGQSHTAIQITEGEALREATAWLGRIDQPSVDGLNVAIISAAVRREGIKVALSGLGGDELFCGYPSFRDVPRIQKLLRQIQFLPPAFRRIIARGIAGGWSADARRKLTDMAGSDGSLLSLYLQRRRVLSDRQLVMLGFHPSELGLTQNYLPPEAECGLETEMNDPIRSISRYESHFYQGNMLLPDTDVNGMSYGLEIRVPMLDRRMLNLAHSIPGHIRMQNGASDKNLLRQAFCKLLRPEILERPKQGFSLPLGQWMRGPLRELCESGLATLATSGLVQKQRLDAIWNNFLKDRGDPAWSRPFSLCSLGLYLASLNTKCRATSDLPS
jgi:asparagine synthase (glutamine-hydrolysing)